MYIIPTKYNPCYIIPHFNTKLGQHNYEIQFDLDNNIINIRDIAIAIRHLTALIEQTTHPTIQLLVVAK